MPIAMITGGLIYLMFSYIPFLYPLRPFVNASISVLTPMLIFTMLFLTFCKVSPRELRPCRWHLWLISIQVVACLSVALYLLTTPNPSFKVALEGTMVCLICPTATAAAVITAKLGGNASSLTTYTILSNVVAAIVVPIIFPLVEELQGDISFWDSFLQIIKKVLPLLIFPFIAAMLIRKYFPLLKDKITSYHDLAFYLWSIALVIVVGQTIHFIVESKADASTLISIGIGSLIACIAQFLLGKVIGGHYNDRISGGQALGQKNTILAIWMAYTYLTPLSSLGPGLYVLWQNIFNSWQLWKKRTKKS